LHRRALVWSERLREGGIGPGDRVLLWGPNSSAWIACFWALLREGAVVVPMDAAASQDFVQRIVRSAGVKLILCDGGQNNLQGAVPSLRYNDFPLADGRLRAPSGAEERQIDGHTIAEILFTSGTTGEPRGVVLTHRNFLANLEPLERGIDPYRRYE